jgi:hypothetical protein
VKLSVRPLRIAALLSALIAPVACQGSWADATVVHLNPVAASGVTGLAVVSIGCTYPGSSHRCMPDGSVIQSQITAANQGSAEYRVILVKGDCARPPSTGVELGAGETAKSPGDSKHLDMPIVALTGGEYAVTVLSSTRSIVACGVIRRDG